MSRQSPWSPLSLLVAGLVVIVILLAGPDIRTGAEMHRQIPAAQVAEDTSDCESYPNPTYNYIPDRCFALTTTPTVSTTSSPSGSRTATATPASRGGRTPTAPPTFDAGFPTRTPSPVEPLAPQETATPELTATPPGEVVCAPGVPVEISGEGPPRAPFLLYFGRRAVSGGSIDPNGRFTIALVVGRERAGAYTVTVQVRGTSQVLRQFTCTVPATTPTPLPRPLFR